ncbi:pentapeptide repeat-containing protein [Pseudonocardia sp.]|uniref:pentapeptide repeat-containing protein n=1 Tax=Pseudonocardia sp. TaxID=60912 RepID=UPI003D14986F
MPPRRRSAARTTVEAPQVPPSYDPPPADPGHRLDGVEFGAGHVFAGPVADLDLRECRFAGTDLSGRVFTGLEVRDTLFEGCDLSGAVLDRAVFSRVVFTGCRLTGTVLSGTTLQDVRITDCRADLLDLRMARADRLLAEDCDLRGADLYEFTATDAALLRCDLTDAELDRADLTGARLHGSTLDGVRGALALRGARIGADQQIPLGAAVLAALGVEVTDQ